MTKKRAFISFEYNHDERAKIVLAGQAKLPDCPFDFKDNSVDEHLAGDWQEKVRRRMDNVDVVIVLCGQHTQRVEQRTQELSEALTAQEQAKRQAEAANQSKTRFLAAASHDLLQPLNAARLFTSALRHQPQLDAESERLAERIDTAFKTAEDLLDALRFGAWQVAERLTIHSSRSRFAARLNSSVNLYTEH